MEYYLKKKNNQESPRSSVKKKNRPDDKINTPKKKKGSLERFRSLDKDDLESTIFSPSSRRIVKTRVTVFCVILTRNHTKVTTRDIFYKSPKYSQVK